MRRAITWILVVVVVLLAAGTAALYNADQKRKAELAQSQQAQQETQDRYAKTISAIAEIQDSLNAISVGEQRVAAESQGLRRERAMNGPQSRDVLDRIAELRSGLVRNKQRIADLESSLHRSGVRVAGLQRLVAQLRRNVAEREQAMAMLTSQVDSLRTEVTGLNTQVAQTQDTLRVRDQTLEERRRDMATVYYVVGNKRDLTKDGVITARGGLLGIGKTLLPTGRTDSPAFTPLDTDQQSVIPTNASKVEKVKVLTAQPPGSYQLVNVDGHVELHIVDPVQFRRVKELVILTT